MHANLGKVGACHLFRHTMATLMLEGGADIRFIQADARPRGLDNHANLHAGGDPQLKQIHAATHPAAMLDKSNAPSLPTRAAQNGEAAPLFAALDAEAEEEKESYWSRRLSRKKESQSAMHVSASWKTSRLLSPQMMNHDSLTCGLSPGQSAGTYSRPMEK